MTTNPATQPHAAGEAAHTLNSHHLPWKLFPFAGEYDSRIWGNGVLVADAATRANAAFIVRACNSHADLVEALKLTVSRMEWFAKHSADQQQAEWITVSIAEARAALANAKT